MQKKGLILILVVGFFSFSFQVNTLYVAGIVGLGLFSGRRGLLSCLKHAALARAVKRISGTRTRRL
jgi:hypothetical protein